jgi:hypothetical protein
MRVWLLVLVGCGRLHFDPLGDAGSDARPDVPSDVPSDLPACAHTFCDDFERPDVQGPWDTTFMAGGMLSIDQGQLLAQTSADLQVAHLAKLLPTANSTVHAEVDVTFDAGNSGEIDLFQIHWITFPGGCSNFGYFLVRDRLGMVEIQETYVNCGLPNSSNDAIASFSPNAPSGPHHIVIDITIGVASSAHLKVSDNGAVQIDQPITAHDVPASAIDIHIGVPGVSMPTAPWAIRYDNVIVDLN